MNPRELIKPCLDADGLVAPNPVPPGTRNSSGNSLMYRAEYQIELARIDPKPGDATEFRQIVRACEIEPGTLKRGPIHTDQNDHDDITAVAAADSWAASRLYLRGLIGVPTRFGRMRWVYNNVMPGTIWHPGEPRNRGERFAAWLFQAPAGHRVNTNAMLWRMPHVVGHIQSRAGVKPNLARRLYWCFVVAFTSFFNPKAQDGWRLTDLLVHGARQRNDWLERPAIWFRAWRLKRHYPDGMAGVRRRYHGWNHPLAVLAESRTRI